MRTGDLAHTEVAVASALAGLHFARDTHSANNQANFSLGSNLRRVTRGTLSRFGDGETLASLVWPWLGWKESRLSSQWLS